METTVLCLSFKYVQDDVDTLPPAIFASISELQNGEHACYFGLACLIQPTFLSQGFWIPLPRSNHFWMTCYLPFVSDSMQGAMQGPVGTLVTSPCQRSAERLLQPYWMIASNSSVSVTTRRFQSRPLQRTDKYLINPC